MNVLAETQKIITRHRFIDKGFIVSKQGSLVPHRVSVLLAKVQLLFRYVSSLIAVVDKSQHSTASSRHRRLTPANDEIFIYFVWGGG